MPLTIEQRLADDSCVLVLTGTLDGSAVLPLLNAIRKRSKGCAELSLALEGVSHADSFGLAALSEGVLVATRVGCRLRATGLSPALRDALAGTPEPREIPASTAPPRLERWGGSLLDVVRESFVFLQLLADTLYWALVAPFQRRFPPPGASVDQAVRIGLEAAPIVMLIGFLMGLIMAFQAAHQLRQFGANIFVANLVGVAMVRELGPLMTAIIVAGRSGSSIAAELGTMTVGEEIDALRTMGIDPIRFLVVPRVYAITFTQPALSLFSMAVGVAGGFLIAVFFLDLSAAAYMKQTLTALRIGDLLHGCTKSMVFAWVIVMISCHSGLRIQGGAVGVGRATTMSVVASIFSIIIVDSIFTTGATLLK